MPKGGFGNLIALPLHKRARENGCSVFVDADLRLYPDQWAFLAALTPMALQDIEPTILRATGGVHPSVVTFIEGEKVATPWQRNSARTLRLAETMPESLTVTLANHINFEIRLETLAPRRLLTAHRLTVSEENDRVNPIQPVQPANNAQLNADRPAQPLQQDEANRNVQPPVLHGNGPLRQDAVDQPIVNLLPEDGDDHKKIEEQPPVVAAGHQDLSEADQAVLAEYTKKLYTQVDAIVGKIDQTVSLALENAPLRLITTIEELRSQLEKVATKGHDSLLAAKTAVYDQYKLQVRAFINLIREFEPSENEKEKYSWGDATDPNSNHYAVLDTILGVYLDHPSEVRKVLQSSQDRDTTLNEASKALENKLQAP